jgi:ABC-type transport system substrate-binding protein
MMPYVRSSRRRLFLAAAAGAIAGGCGKMRRRPGRLTYLLRNEPNTFDPAKSPGGGELWIFAALFEPLLQAHPQTLEPMAGLATHYKVERGGTQYTFYLRGHPAPQGIRLPGRESLEPEFSRGAAATLNGLPARWSDGVPITAQDLVYSWRRYLAPETGFSSAYYLYYVSGAEEVNSGKRSPRRLRQSSLSLRLYFAFNAASAVPTASSGAL